MAALGGDLMIAVTGEPVLTGFRVTGLARVLSLFRPRPDDAPLGTCAGAARPCDRGMPEARSAARARTGHRTLMPPDPHPPGTTTDEMTVAVLTFAHPEFTVTCNRTAGAGPAGPPSASTAPALACMRS
jgi:hypothetical protein